MSPIKQKTAESLDLSKPAGKLPGPMDVVLFRGSGTNLHDGSKRFRAMVDSYTYDFIAAKSRPEKYDIVMQCIQKHKARGGRFVGYYDGMYYHATEKKAYKKTIQRLRDQKAEVQKILLAVDGGIRNLLEEDFDEFLAPQDISPASKA